MKFELVFDEIYAHPVEKVWRALTDGAALARWLMENDLDLGKDRRFRMWCDDDQGQTHTILCEVLVMEAPHRMVWSWVLESRQAEGVTTVAFALEPVVDGTRLTIRHTGDRDPQTIDAFKGGWPEKLRQLGAVLPPGAAGPG